MIPGGYTFTYLSVWSRHEPPSRLGGGGGDSHWMLLQLGLLLDKPRIKCAVFGRLIRENTLKTRWWGIGGHGNRT